LGHLKVGFGFARGGPRLGEEMRTSDRAWKGLWRLAYHRTPEILRAIERSRVLSDDDRRMVLRQFSERLEAIDITNALPVDAAVLDKAKELARNKAREQPRN
jgi:hypothetical protein